MLDDKHDTGLNRPDLCAARYLRPLSLTRSRIETLACLLLNICFCFCRTEC